MKWVTLILMLSLNVFAADVDLGPETLQNICQSPRTPVRLIDNWEVRGTPSHGFCSTAVCNEGDKLVTGSRCLFSSQWENTIQIQRTFYDGDNQFARRTELNQVDVPLTRATACHEECKEVPKRNFLGIVTGQVKRLERRECLTCMARSYQSDVNRYLTHPQTGARIYNRTKCYELCSPPRGPFNLEGTIADENACNSCVNESYSYLLTKEGSCVEIDSTGKDRFVDRAACEGKPLMATEYYFEPESVGLIGFFTGAQPDPTKGTCWEIDSPTQGMMYKRTTYPENCPAPEAVVETDRSVQPKEDDEFWTIFNIPSPGAGRDSRGGASSR